MASRREKELLNLPKADLNAFVEKGNYRIKLESIEVEHPQDAKLRRLKELVLFLVALLMILGVFCFCLFVVFSPIYSSEEKKWATTALGIILSALVTYLVSQSNVNRP